MSHRGLNLVLLGPPGSGKGTQARILARLYRIQHIATGDMLRDAISAGTSLGCEVQETMANGELVPDSVVAGLILERLDREDTRRGFILDGYPRNEAQTGVLDGILAELGRSLERVMLLEVSADRVVARVSGRRSCPACQRAYHEIDRPSSDGLTCDHCSTKLIQRADDAESVVRSRLDIYHDLTRPLISLYRGRGVLVGIDGEQPVDQVTESLVAGINQPAPV